MKMKKKLDLLKNVFRFLSKTKVLKRILTLLKVNSVTVKEDTYPTLKRIIVKSSTLI